MKIMLDTNALIDFIARRAPYDADLRRLCIASVFGDVQIWVSVQSYTDAYYLLCKQAPRQEVKRSLLATLDLFLVCGTSVSDLRAALESDFNDIEDYLITASAKHVPVDYFITRDKELIARSKPANPKSVANAASKTRTQTKLSLPVQAMTAHDFLDFLATEHGLTYTHINLGVSGNVSGDVHF